VESVYLNPIVPAAAADTLHALAMVVGGTGSPGRWVAVPVESPGIGSQLGGLAGRLK
jgi:hypothetical protein